MIRRESNPSPLQVETRSVMFHLHKAWKLPRLPQDAIAAKSYPVRSIIMQIYTRNNSRRCTTHATILHFPSSLSFWSVNRAQRDTRPGSKLGERERENSDQERREKDGGKSLINKQNSRRLVTNWCIGDGIRGLGRYVSAQQLVKQT